MVELQASILLVVLLVELQASMVSFSRKIITSIVIIMIINNIYSLFWKLNALMTHCLPLRGSVTLEKQSEFFLFYFFNLLFRYTWSLHTFFIAVVPFDTANTRNHIALYFWKSYISFLCVATFVKQIFPITFFINFKKLFKLIGSFLI